MATTIRVVLADDHILVREGLRRLIDEQAEMEVVGEASDGPEAVAVCETVNPDVALLDVSMPTWDGVRTARALRAACPRTHIIGVSRYNNPGLVVRMFAAGAVGYVLKQSASIHLIAAMRAAVGGERYVDPAIRSMPIPVAGGADVTAPAPASEPLDGTEEDVLRLAACSFSGREIADQLGLAGAAAAEVKARAMAKLGLSTRHALIEYARRRGWR